MDHSGQHQIAFDRLPVSHRTDTWRREKQPEITRDVRSESRHLGPDLSGPIEEYKLGVFEYTNAMERINDGRRNILIHGETSIDELPVDGLDQLPSIASTEPFLPDNLEGPEIYPGDVILGVENGEIVFAELIYNRINEGILVVPLNTGIHELVSDSEFSSRFYSTEEVHIYDNVTDDVVDVDVDVQFDETEVDRPQTSRPR